MVTTHTEDLAEAIAAAVRDGMEAADDLEERLTTAFSKTLERHKDLRAYASEPRLSEEARDAAATFLENTDGLRRDTAALLERQKATLDEFNIVFFGRTGAGKSSLMEALSRGSGEAISPAGASDWTVDVRRVTWQACVLHDIPGINGWGRERPREELEEVARSAVEIADLVILTFDNQSQQAQEFNKVAAWVQSYGKPVVAVLNCRNPLWRLPPRVPSARNRKQLSRAVQQHATNIATELAKIGLRNVPVVALQTKRAVFACATEPYEGPDAKSFEAHRAEYGTDELYAWSNLGALERLLVNAVRDDAVAIRLGMLHGQLRGAIAAASKDWRTSERRASGVAEDLERTIETVLGIVGAAAAADPLPSRARSPRDRKTAAAARRTAKRLRELEGLRDGDFAIPREADLARFMRHRLAAELGPERERTMDRAMRATDRALERRKRLSASELRKVVFDEAAIDSATSEVLVAVRGYLEERVGQAIADVEDDLKVRTRLEEDIDGTAGQVDRAFGRAFGAGALGGGALAALGGLALANSWNPLGWTAAGALIAALAGSVISGVFGWLSGRKRKAAEAKRQRERGRARRYIRAQVNETFEDLGQKLSRAAGEVAAEAGRAALERPVELAIALRRVEAAAGSALSVFSEVSDGLAPEGAAARALRAARTRTQKEAGVRRPAELWLGEDWLRIAGKVVEPTPLTWQPDDTMDTRLDAAWRRVGRAADVDSGKDWLVEFERVLATEPATHRLRRRLRAVAKADRPRIAVCGDYSAGKTSFLRRLLAEAGKPLPNSLRTAGGPTTATADEYEWLGVTLVDTPGLQSGNAAHDAEAERAVLGSAALIYLFNPNLVVGQSLFLERTLKGSEDALLPAMSGRTLFVISRSDELGIDPEDDPDGYRTLCDGKRAELARAFSSIGVTISADDVFCIASNPYGLAADDDPSPSPETFARTARWDGVAQLVSTFGHHQDAIADSGVDTAILEMGAAGLRTAARELEEERAETDRQHRELGRVRRELGRAARRGATIEADARHRLRTMISDHVDGLWADTLQSTGPEREALVEQLQSWWDDEGLKGEIEEWGNRLATDLQSWAEDSEEALSRRVNTPAFKVAFPNLRAAGLGFLRPARRSRARKVASTGQTAAGALGKNKAVVLDVFHRFGYKFKPWGATKAATRFAKVGAVLGVVSFTWDALTFVRAEVADRRSAERLEAAQSELRTMVEDAVVVLADGTARQPGPCAVLLMAVRDLEEYADALGTRARELRRTERSLIDRIDRVEMLARKAWAELEKAES